MYAFTTKTNGSHWKLFSLMLCLSFMLSIGAMANDFCLIEDFDNIPSFPYGDWEATGNIPGIANGEVQFTGDSGLFWNNCYHAVYVPYGMCIQLDGWLTGSGWHYTDIWFGLSKNYAIPGISGYDPLVQMTFNKNDGLNRFICEIFSDDPNHQEQYHTPADAYTPEEWNTAKIKILPSGHVEFWVTKPEADPELLYTTTKTIDPSYNGLATLFVMGNGGNGPAYMDNLKLCEPCPGTNMICEKFETLTTLPEAPWQTHNNTQVLENGTVKCDGNSGILYHEDYHACYADGLCIKLDGWLTESGWHYSDIWFGLSREWEIPSIPGYNPLVQMTFNKNDGLHRFICEIHSDDPNHQEQYHTPAGSYTPEEWNSAWIKIRPDGYVEFWVKKPDAACELLYTTTKTIDPSYEGIASFYVQQHGSGGVVYMDNIKVTELNPAHVMETWTGVTSLPNDDWAIVSQDGSHWPILDTGFGKDAPCIRYEGGNNQAALVTEKNYTAYYLDGEIIELDGWCSGSGSHYTDIWFGLSQNSEITSIGDVDPVVQMTFNKNAGLNRFICEIMSPDPNHHEQYHTPADSYVANDWNRARITILPSGHVEFSVLPAGGVWTHLYTTTKTIDPAYNGVASFYAQGLGGGGSALSYVDNIKICEIPDGLYVDRNCLSASAGGTIHMCLNGGLQAANKEYMIVSGISGNYPGISLNQGTVILPVNWDIFTDIEMMLLNSPVFSNFYGTLDAYGKANAALYLPAGVAVGSEGAVLTSAFVTGRPFDYASNHVSVHIVD